MRSPVRVTALVGLVGLFGLFGLLGLSACQDYLFVRVCAEQIVEEDQTFAAAQPKPADILFVVDNSCSMAEEQQNLADNFGLFINEIAGTGDYRIAVVTTDQTSPQERAGLTQFSFADEPFYERTEFDTGQCVSTGIPRGCFRGTDPNARIIDSGAFSPTDQIAFFEDNVLVGTCGSGTEQGLKAMMSALDQTGDAECNQDFLREEANLVVIFVSDENDDDDTPIADYVEYLGTVKDYGEIRVAAITGFVQGEASDCRTDMMGQSDAVCGALCEEDPPARLLPLWNSDVRECASCSSFRTPDCCLADAGSRYVQFARLIEARIAAEAPGLEVNGCTAGTGSRAACLLGSVCQASFGQTLVQIARDLVVVNEYVLEPPATNPDGVRARLVGGRFGEEGRPLVPGVDFDVGRDQAGQGVTLVLNDRDLIPAEDEEIEIVYVSEVERGKNQRPEVCEPPAPVE